MNIQIIEQNKTHFKYNSDVKTMDKINATSTVFYYVAKNLEEELVNGYINNIQAIDEQTIKIKIHKTKTKQLIVNPNICFLSEYILPTSQTKGLAYFLKQKLFNQRIHEIKQDKNNRVIYFKLDKFYLIFEFFSNSNIILTDLDLVVITSKQKEEWKDRIIKKGEKYSFPSNIDFKKLNINEIIESIEPELNKKITDLTKKDLISYLVKKYSLPPADIEIIVGEKEKITKETIKNIKEIYNYKTPRIVILDRNDNKIISIVNEEGALYSELETYYLEIYKDRAAETNTTKKEKREIILEEQTIAKAKFETEIQRLNKEGEQIYSHFTYIDQINKQIEIATTKKINEKEIITKINDYLIKSKLGFEIKSINQKKKTYIIDFK